MKSMTLMQLPADVETVDPLETKIIVRLVPTSIADIVLIELREVAKPRGLPSDCLRSWLRGKVDAEIARRSCETDVVEEPAAWKINWHEWTDLQLAAALAASYSWFEVSALSPATVVVLREVHRALVTACGTRLREFHTAIENAQHRQG